MGKQNNEYGSKYVYNTSTGAYGEGDASTETGARRRKLSQKDYEKILESLAKSNASDAKLTSYLHSRGVDDADIDLLMADRKKKIQSSDSTSPSKVTGLSLVFPETEKMVAQVEKEGSFLVGDPLKVSQQALQYDIQQNEQNKKVIQAVSYNSFLEYENLMKDIIGDEKYNNPNEMFELLVDKDEEYQNEVLPYKNAIARVDLQIAEELGVLDAYKSGIQRRTSKKSLEDSWAPFSSMTASKIKLSKEQIGAIQAVNNEIQNRGVKMATEYDTDDFVQKASEIRDKYRSKYGSQFSEVFQKNFKGTIPEQYANSPFALKKIEDYMHQMNSSVDLNGDGRIYQRGTALGRGYNQFVLGTFEMVADVANVIADQTDNEDFKKLASETKQQILDKKTQEGTVENQGFSLSDFVTGEGGSVTGLINKTVSLTSQSLPYMMGVGATQKVATKAGLTLLGSKTLAKYTASTVGMGTISAASAYSNGMGQEWFEELSPIGKLGYSSIHGLAEGGGETVSFALFNKMIAPVLKTGTQATKQTFTEFIKGATKAYGWNVSEEIIAESATALVQTTAEILARGEEVTWEKLNDRVVEAIEGAILMTSGLQGTTTAVRAPFEVQNLHISSKLGLGDTKLRSRAIITRLSDEYVKENDERRKGIIGEQLAKALYNESVRNKQNVDFFEAIRKQSPEDHARLLEIADSFDKKVDTWKSMEEGTAKSVLGAEIKDMFKEKLSIEEKYKDITGEAAPVNATPEAAAIARKINSGESLTIDEETFYAENQAEVEEAVSNVGIRELYVPFEMNGKVEPTIELTEENRDATLDNLINNAETLGDDIFKGFRTTREAVIKGLESIKGAMRAIKTVNPNAKFFVHTSAEAFKKATGLKKLSRGYYKSGNTVHFLAPAMTSTTGYHESTHAAFMETLGAKSYDKLFGEIVKSLRNSPEGLIAGDVIRNFIEGYNPEGRSEEGVTEFIAMLAAGEIDVRIEKGILRKIAEVMGSVLPFNVSIPSRTQGVQILKDIADSMREGAPVDPDKIQKVKARRDKGQEASDKAQAIEAVDNEDGSVMSAINRESISETAGKEQVITAEAPQYTLNEIFEKTEGRVIVITSDNTGIGNVDGKDVMGGIGYSFLQENLRDGVGFASTDLLSVSKVRNMVEKIGEGKDVAVLVMQQHPDGMLGNFYAAEYLADAITTTFKGNRKKAADDIKKRLMSLAPINNSGQIELVEDFIDGISNEATKSEAVAKIIEEMSFPLRRSIVESILPKGYGIVGGKKTVNPNAKTSVPLYKQLAEAGFSQVDFWKKYSSPETNTEEYLNNALNGDWGYTYSGFITNSTLDWGEEFQKKGVTHPQFNAKLPSKETFKLDGGYQVDEALKDVLTYGYNKKKNEYTKPPAGLSRSTSQSIFAGSFQQSTQEAVLELVAQPSTDPFNQYAMLASTQEGKAQIIGELGASKSHKMINKLELARDMEEAGKDKEAIFLATGWYRGIDNQWRSEIRYGHIRKSFFESLENLGKAGVEGIDLKLSEVLDSPVLYEMYPNIKDYVFTIEFMNYFTMGYHQRSYKDVGKIAVNSRVYFEEVDGKYRPKKGKSFTGLMDTIYHEVQHAVQAAEGVTDGYSEGRVNDDVWYSKKRTLNTAKTQLKVTDTLFKEMMEIGEEQMIKNHRMLAYLGNALDMDYNSEDASKALTDAYVYSGDKWMDLFDIREIEALAALNPEEITAENFPNELVMPMLKKRNRGIRSWVGDVSAFEVLKYDNLGEEADALKSFKTAIEAAKYFVNNGGAKALEFEKKMRSSAEKHYKFFNYAFKNINIDSADPGYNIRNRVEYLSKVAKGAAVNIARFTKKKVESVWDSEKMTDFDVYQRNLGEAEARLAGKRGTQKLKNRAPLISELYPDVDNSEIWQLPPASFYTKIEDRKKELKTEKNRLEDLKMDFDSDLTKGLDRYDIPNVEEKVSQLENSIKVLTTKLQDALSDKKGKAQLIEGTFEDALFRKETQEQLIREGVDNFFKSDTGVNRLFEHLRFKFADKYRPLQNLQTAIEKEKNRLERTDSNFRRAEALMHGKAAEDARQFEEQQLKPLMDKMVEYGVTNEQISEYLYALHAYERNEFVKNTIDPANEAGSGMTNEVAEEIKKKYAGQKEKMDELAEMSYAIAQASRDMMLEFGLISKAQYDSFKMFENYVPLVGTAVAPTSDLFDFTDSRSAQDGSKGAGISVFGREYRNVTGRFSEAQSPLETIVSNHLRTISRARKNEVLQTLLNLVTENKDSRVWEVFTEEKPDMRVRVSSRGTPVFIEEATGEDYEYTLRRKMAAIAMAGNPDYVPVKVNGKTSYIKFRDSRITRVLNAGGVGKTNAFVKGLSVASRWFTKVFTSYNPEFIFANLTRDVQTAMFNQMAEQNMQLSTISGQDFVTQSFRGVPAAIQAVYQFEKGNRKEMNAEMRGFYEEYLASGAKTDWFFLKTAEQVEADMLKYIRRTAPITSEASLREKARRVGEKGTATMENVGEFVDILNTSIENGVRFSAYVAARKNGVDVDKAAEFVKELTINFNRSGEMGALANSFYLFFNASVQGSTRMMRSLVKSKKARQVAAGMTAFSSLLTMMNIAVGGEDEDGIPFYDKIPDYEKERFLIIMYGNGKYGKIPLPYGINIFFNLGTSVSELVMGVSKPSEVGSFMMNSVVQSFSPVSISSSENFGYGLMKTLSPTVLKPITELSINEDYFGNRIYKDDFYFGADTPDATRFDKNTAEWAKSMAQFLNEVTGGSEYESGLIDWSPDSIEYLFTFMGGGAAKFAQRTAKATTKIAKGKADEIEMNDVPLARLFLGTVRENEAAGRYYETRKELLKEKNNIVGAVKSGKEITPEMRKINTLLGYEKQVQAEIKKLGTLEKKALQIEDVDKREEALKAIRDRKIKTYKWFNARYYALMGNETK